MTPRACLVVTTTATVRGDALAAAVAALRDAGWDARVFCKGDAWIEDPALNSPALESFVELTNVKRKRFPLPRSLRRNPADLARYLSASGDAGPFDERLLELRPDLIHFHSGWSAWKGMRVADMVGSRVVVSFRGDGQDLEVPDLSDLWNAELFLFPDREALDCAVARGCPRERAEVLPSAVSLPGNGRANSDALRAVTVAPVTWEQGLEHSVHALRLALDMGVDCEYQIMGEGDHMLAVAFARHQLGLTDRVDLRRENGGDPLDEALSAADVIVDPAVADVSSRPLEMAQALGVPFVATRREGLPADAGIAVPPRDPRAIAEAIAALARDPQLRRRMGEAGLARTGPYTTTDRHARRLEELYARVIGEG